MKNGPTYTGADVKNPSVGKTSIERNDFSKRLQEALRSAAYSPSSPTLLSREFNLRFTGPSITVHAARKWLVGEAIPTQEKLRVLADWLCVPTEWLRFGGSPVPVVAASGGPQSRLDAEDVKVITDLQQLDDHYRTIVHELVRMLLRTGRQG